MSVQTPSSDPSSGPAKSKHSRKRTHDQSSLSQAQSQASESPSAAMPADSGSPTKKPRRSLGQVKLSSSSSAALDAATSLTSKKSLRKPKPDTADTSPFTTRRSAFYLPLAPITAHSGFSLAGLCAEHLSPLLLTYYPPLRGIILAYSDPSLSTAPPTASDSANAEDGTPLARSIDEYGTPYVWLTATFTLLAPAKGTRLRGYPSVFSEQHVGLLCYNLFNAHVGYENMPVGWSWVPAGQAATGRKGANGSGAKADTEEESGGHWVDDTGKRISLDDELSFTVVNFESVGLGAGVRDRGFLTLEGTMKEGDEQGQSEQANTQSGGQDVLMSGGAGGAGINGEKTGKSRKSKSSGGKPRERSQSDDY